MTPDGFYSIVQKHGETDLCIRARVGADLDRLRERYLPSLSETIETPHGDYRYRAWAPHEQVAEALGAIARDLHYDNFKNEVARCDPERAHVYGSVWSVLRRLQPRGTHSGEGAQVPKREPLDRKLRELPGYDPEDPSFASPTRPTP